MIAALRTIQLHPGQQEAFLHAWQSEPAAALRRQPGCRGVYVLGSAHRDELILFSLWDDETALQTWQDSDAHQQSHQQLAEFWLSPPTLMTYTVLEQITQ
jgi:heme-degrading monooxygenase HmoA